MRLIISSTALALTRSPRGAHWAVWIASGHHRCCWECSTTTTFPPLPPRPMFCLPEVEEVEKRSVEGIEVSRKSVFTFAQLFVSSLIWFLLFYFSTFDFYFPPSHLPLAFPHSLFFCCCCCCSFSNWGRSSSARFRRLLCRYWCIIFILYEFDFTDFILLFFY